MGDFGNVNVKEKEKKKMRQLGGHKCLGVGRQVNPNPI